MLSTPARSSLHQSTPRFSYHYDSGLELFSYSLFTTLLAAQLYPSFAPQSMDITALLNPTQDTRLRRRSTTTTTARSTAYSEAEYTPEPSSSHNFRKTKGKFAKDAPKYQTGPVKGEVRYPPYSIGERYILKRLEKHNISPPLNKIFSMPQTIPYSSEKKPFSSRTSLGGFEGEQSCLTYV